MSLTDEQIQEARRITRKAEEAAAFLVAVRDFVPMYGFEPAIDYEGVRSNLCEARASINELLRELPESEY